MDGVYESSRDGVPPSNLLACGMDEAFQSLGCGMDEGDELNRGEAHLPLDPLVYGSVPVVSSAWAPLMVWVLPTV